MNNDLPLFCKALNQIRRNAINEIKTAAFNANLRMLQVSNSCKTAAHPVGSFLKLLGKGLGNAAKGAEKRVIGTTKTLLPYGAIVATPYVGQKGFMDFVYPELKQDFGGTLKEIKEGVPIMTREYLDRSGKKISDTIDNTGRKLNETLNSANQNLSGAVESVHQNVNKATENVAVRAGDKINTFVDALDWLGRQTAGHAVWSLAGTGGAALGWKALKETKKQRIRNAERYRNEAYRKLQRDEALGTISGGQYDEVVKDLEKETAKREKTRIIDYFLPALAAAGGLGGGYLGYKHITGSKSAAVMDHVDTLNPFMSEDRKFERTIDRRGTENLKKVLKYLKNQNKNLADRGIRYEGDLQNDTNRHLKDLLEEIAKTKQKKDRYKRYAESVGYMSSLESHGKILPHSKILHPAILDSIIKERQGTINNGDSYYGLTYHPNPNIVVEGVMDFPLTPLKNKWGGGQQLSRPHDAYFNEQYWNDAREEIEDELQRDGEDENPGYVERRLARERKETEWANNDLKRDYLASGNKGSFVTIHPKERKAYTFHVPSHADWLDSDIDIKKAIDSYFSKNPINTGQGYTPFIPLESSFERTNPKEKVEKKKRKLHTENKENKNTPASKVAAFNTNLSKLQILNAKYCQ
jgi:hypothetical protein